jgi:hypothetical protein
LGNVVIFPTIHDRGLSYSNRFTLCRGCTLYPQDSINPPGYHNGLSYTSMRGSDNRSKSSIHLPYYGCLPCGFYLPGMPRQYLLQSVTPAPRRENPSVFRRLGICRDMYCPILGDNPDSGVACTIFSRYHEPLYSMRLPALKQTNFKLGLVPYRGNVVARVNCSERLQRNTNAFL